MEDILDLCKNQGKLHSYIQQGDSWLVQKWVKKIVPMTGYLKIYKLLHLFPSIQFASFLILKKYFRNRKLIFLSPEVDVFYEQWLLFLNILASGF